MGLLRGELADLDQRSPQVMLLCLVHMSASLCDRLSMTPGELQSRAIRLLQTVSCSSLQSRVLAAAVQGAAA